MFNRSSFLVLLLLLSPVNLISIRAEQEVKGRVLDIAKGTKLEGQQPEDADQSEEYINEWAVYIPAGLEVATAVAEDLGYKNLGQIGSLDGYYLLSRPNHHRRSKRHSTRQTRALSADNRVEWAEQQRFKKRVKRDLIEKRDEEQAYKRAAAYDDVYWDSQWYLFDSRVTTDVPKMDLHVIPLWAKNYTGDGVVVTILDDGIEHNHTDLAANYDPQASYDFNGEDDDPFPRYDETDENKHGTRCAGEVAMVANNKKCGVGVAYNAKIGGIRMLDGKVTDSLEARALSFNINHVDIFSASWGPSDDGKTLERPGRLARAAFEKGVTEGRGGKGVIYVWASGNGGFHSDNCDCDGYTGSIYTLSISSASQQSKSPWYAEQCPSTMATTYSSGAFLDQKIISTDLHDQCTTGHTGTSASAPLAAGIFALVLQVNPDLTWRDLQHLVAWTSEVAPLKNNPGWHRNGAGFWVNNRFGFGLLNAAALANAADKLTFRHVPDKAICEVKVDPEEQGLPRYIRGGQELTMTFDTDGCKGQRNEVNYLEHVVLTLDIVHSRRGNLEIFLMSPQGTETQLLTKRPQDLSKSGFRVWPFMSVHTWGENPSGTWKIRIVDQQESGNEEGLLKSVLLTLHGTKEKPHHMKIHGGQRTYNMDYNNVHNTRKSANPSEEAKLSESNQQNLKQLLNQQSEKLSADKLSDKPTTFDEGLSNQALDSEQAFYMLHGNPYGRRARIRVDYEELENEAENSKEQQLLNIPEELTSNIISQKMIEAAEVVPDLSISKQGNNLVKPQQQSVDNMITSAKIVPDIKPFSGINRSGISKNLPPVVKQTPQSYYDDDLLTDGDTGRPVSAEQFDLESIAERLKEEEKLLRNQQMIPKDQDLYLVY